MREPLLVGLQLLFQGLHQGGNGRLPLRQVTLGRLGELAKGLVGQPEKFRLRLLERVSAEGLEGIAQIGERLVLRRLGILQLPGVQLALLGEQMLRGLKLGLRAGKLVAGLRQLRAGVAQIRLATRPMTVYSGSIPLLKKKLRFGAKSSMCMPRAR